MSEKFREYKRKLRWKSGMRKHGINLYRGGECPICHQIDPDHAPECPIPAGRLRLRTLGDQLFPGTIPATGEGVPDAPPEEWQ